MRANFVMSGVTEGLRRNLLMSIALVLTTAVSLSFVAAAILTGVEIDRFRSEYEAKLSVSLYLCQGTTPREPLDPTKEAADNACEAPFTDAQLSTLRSRLSSDPRVKSVDFVSAQQSYQNGLKILEPALAKELHPGDLPAYLSVKLENIKADYDAVAQQYGTAPGVLHLQNEDESLKTILRLFSGAFLAAIVVAAVVLLSAVILIAITIQVAAAQRRNETSIMRLVGASRWMTQLPFIIEAVIAAAIGGVLGMGVAWIGKYYMLDNLLHTEVNNKVIPSLTTNDVIVAGGVSLITGILLAAVTAYAALRLYVRL